MSNWPFRFVHAADFHLERPPFGVTEVPDHLRDLFVEAVYRAAERVFDTALSQEVDFLVLAGDLLEPRWTGPRGLLFLAEQFRRLAEREIAVYWAGGRVDPPDAWPAAVRLPDRVHVFPQDRAQEHVHHRDGTPLARVMGVSRTRNRGVRVSEFDPDPGGLFSIAVVHGSLDAESLRARGIDYWALGGRHARHTLFSSPHVGHYPGSPQGRHAEECGPHGCTLVQVDAERTARSTLVPADVMRWQTERIAVEESTTRESLERLLHERMQRLVETAPGMDLLVSWTIVGEGRLVAELREGPLAAQVLQMLRNEYGFGPPAAWSLSLTAEPTAMLPPEWYEQQTIRGDFLRELRRHQTDPNEPIELESYLADEQVAGTLGAAADLSDHVTREQVLREAAVLGVDLLSGEEPEP